MFSVAPLRADLSEMDSLIPFFRELAGGPDDVPGFGFGELIYTVYRSLLPPPHEVIGIARDPAGEIAALCWLEPENEFAFLVPPRWRDHPERPALHQVLLDFAIHNLDRITPERSKPIGLTIERHDLGSARIAHDLGLRATGDTRHHTFRIRDGQNVDTPFLPEGCRVVTLRNGDLIDQRVALVKAVWPEHTLDADRYRAIRSAPLYDADLDLCIQSAEGRLVAFATGWWDAETRVGQFEPAGTHPDARGRGLARALVQHGTRLLLERGAERIFINCYAKNEAGNALYAAAGYDLVGEWQWWEMPEGDER